MQGRDLEDADMMDRLALPAALQAIRFVLTLPGLDITTFDEKVRITPHECCSQVFLSR